MEKFSDGAKVRFPPPLIYLGGFLLGIAGDRLLHLRTLGLDPNIRDILSVVLIVAGLLMSFAGAGLFVQHRTAIIPYKPATRLVTSGIYRWTRNPMYLGLALLYAGFAILSNSLLALILLAPVIAIIQTQVIAREEAYLQRAFGSEYVAYRKRVRPWI
jgi:protein-S-isoprenylcysteine O-methyltransferase Ste14